MFGLYDRYLQYGLQVNYYLVQNFSGNFLLIIELFGLIIYRLNDLYLHIDVLPLNLGRKRNNINSTFQENIR